MKKYLLFSATVLLGLGLMFAFLLSAKDGLAKTVDDIPDPPPTLGDQQPVPVSLDSYTPSDSSSGLLSVQGSSITTDRCYQENKTETYCFSVYNGSNNNEWLSKIELTFPNEAALGTWTVDQYSMDASDSVGNPISMTVITSTNMITYTDGDAEFGEISPGSSWGFCVDLEIPSGYGGNKDIDWTITGDDGKTLTDTISMEACTPLWFNGSVLQVEGCNGMTQTHTIELWNYSAGSGVIELDYATTPIGSLITGTESLTISNGEVSTFTVQFKPDYFLKAGDIVTATISAEKPGVHDEISIVNTVTEHAGWLELTDLVTNTMDNVVIWASYADNGLWSIGGYGSNGATQRYDAITKTWQTFTSEVVLTPTIEYPIDGCYGLNGDEDEIIVLFPDTIVTNTLHIFNITERDWYTAAIPAGYPVDGRWGQDIVSMLNHTEDNVCYLTCGGEQSGGGTTRDLYTYYPYSNTIGTNKDFTGSFWPAFHASWYVPWIGDEGAICIAGGAEHNLKINAHSQCYDIAADDFNAPDADLGALPEPWWGMADGWQIVDGEYQIWLANGVAQDGTLLPISAYASEDSGGFVYGPAIPKGLYRLEGSGFLDQFVTVGGSQGGFWESKFHFSLTPCPTCYDQFLPTILNSMLP